MRNWAQQGLCRLTVILFLSVQET